MGLLRELKFLLGTVLVVAFMLNLALPIVMSNPANASTAQTSSIIEVPICTMDGISYMSVSVEEQNKTIPSEKSRFECALCFVVSNLSLSIVDTLLPSLEDVSFYAYKTAYFSPVYHDDRPSITASYISRAPPVFS